MPNSARKDVSDALGAFLDQLSAQSDHDQAAANAAAHAGVHAGRVLCDMVDAGLDQLSLPGSGHTLQRWRMLAAVAAHDLSLAKLYEAHTDALAILAEAEAEPAPPLSVWGVWCAEPPQARLELRRGGAEGSSNASSKIVLEGRKAWCSGANVVTHAIVSGWNQDGQACLASVDLDQPGVTVRDQGWHAVGMAGTVSVEVEFEQASGVAIGGPDFYTTRPGFWHGGAGIAACWHGAAAQLVSYLRARLAMKNDAYALAHLGRAEVALSASAWGLRAAARQIDQEPSADAYRIAMRARLATEHAATEVMQLFGRAVGPTALCLDPWVARMMADLPVFLRQSHAEHDLAALAQATLQADEGDEEWRL